MLHPALTQWAAAGIVLVARSKLPHLLPQRRGASGRLAAYYEMANHPAPAADPQTVAPPIDYRRDMALPRPGGAAITLWDANFTFAGRLASRRRPCEAQITL